MAALELFPESFGIVGMFVAEVCVFVARYGWQNFVLRFIEFYVEYRRVFQFVFGGWWHAAQCALVDRMQCNVSNRAGGILYRVRYQHTCGDAYTLILMETCPSV